MDIENELRYPPVLPEHSTAESVTLATAEANVTTSHNAFQNSATLPTSVPQITDASHQIPPLFSSSRKCTWHHIGQPFSQHSTHVTCWLSGIMNISVWTTRHIPTTMAL
eukprot:12901760-Prorocentrum_lima.AAC.1